VPTATEPAEDNTPQVCAASATTVEQGLDRFVAEMNKVGAAATAGDLAAADRSVKDAGTQLIALANGLRADASKAVDKDVKATLEDLADEFEAQGRSLTDLTALQSFDVKRIEALSARMSQLCGGPSPSPLPVPTPSPTG
jgi:hypothetical protein